MNVGQVRPQDVTNKPVLIQRPSYDAARPALRNGPDAADVSDAARQTKQQADVMAARLRAPDLERQRVIEAARNKLQSGELDDARVLRATAERMLDEQR
jgi:hypothetical protein